MVVVTGALLALSRAALGGELVEEALVEVIHVTVNYIHSSCKGGRERVEAGTIIRFGFTFKPNLSHKVSIDPSEPLVGTTVLLKPNTSPL